MTIENIAQKYNQFQSDFGAHVEQNYDGLIENLFSVNFSKIANGKVLVAKADELKGQLLAVRDFAGGWTLDVKQVIPSANDHSYVVRYILNTEKAGGFDVMAIIGSSDGIKIDFIDEIYYQI